MKALRLILLVGIILVIAGQGMAQEEKKEKKEKKEKQEQEEPSFPENYRRNTIKWNLTPFILWDKRNINLSYERILKPHRSFSVNAGYFVLPSLGLFDSLEFKNTKKKNGFSVSGDYRYYFKKRNKNLAPDGLFWGFWGSYHHYQFSNELKVLDNPDIQGSLYLDGKYNIVSLGVELGYQFVVIKDKFVVDLILAGPALTVYNGLLELDGDLTLDEENEYLEAIRDILFNQVPGLEKLVNDGVIRKTGASTSLGFGLRYMIQVGYRF